MLLVGGVWKVADFGLSATPADAPTTTSPSDSATDPLVVGTPEYMGPERLCGARPDDLDARCDIYSLGVVLHELLHARCRRPFAQPHRAGDTGLRRLRLTPMTGIAPAAARVIGKCLAADPAARYASVRRLLAALDGRGDSPDQLATLWRQACARVEQHQWPRAARLCRRILQQRPTDANARAMLRDLRARYRRAGKLYAALQQDLDRRNLEELGALLAAAIDTYPEHPDGEVVQVRLALKARQYRAAMEAGAAAVRRGDWAAALNWFARARELNAGAPAPEGAAHFAAGVLAQLGEARARIDRAVAAGDRAGALTLARGLDDYLERSARALAPPGGPTS